MSAETIPAAGLSAHVAFCREVRARFRLGREGRTGLPLFPRVVVIAASSRGGSSLLYELLRSTRAFLTIGGEHSVLYKLHNLGLPDDADAHDGVIPNGADRAGFRADLAADVTTGAEPETVNLRQLDAAAVADRFVRALAQQWPPGALSIEDTWRIAHEAIDRRLSSGKTDRPRLLMACVRALRAHGWGIDPWYFDVDPTVVTRAFPGLPAPTGPPPGLVQTVEAPPFLVPSLAPLPGPDDLHRPLLLKASMDAYRIAQLPLLFPQSELTVIHLVRNPAAAVNGLIDGWLDRGFFSHNLGGRVTLNIPGYSESAGWSTEWWNFDLPPGWPDLLDSPLPRVCAAQWTAAHTHILAALESTALPTLRVAAEQVLDERTRPAAIDEILRRCGVRAAVPARSGVVMATQLPELGRWRYRRSTLEPIITSDAVRACSVRLGYDTPSRRGWT